MVRETRTVGLVVPLTPANVRILSRNPNRVSYSIFNYGPTNFVCVSCHQQVNANAAAAVDHNTGQQIVVNQSVSDTDDKDEVYASANTAACTVIVQEVVEPISGRGGR